MNKARRKSIGNAIADLSNLKFGEDLKELAGKIDDIKSEVDNLLDEEQEYYDNMPEGLQSGDKGDTAQEAISHLDSAIGFLDDAIYAADDTDNTPEAILEEMQGKIADATQALEDAQSM